MKYSIQRPVPIKVQRLGEVSVQTFRVDVGNATGPRGITDNVLFVVRHGSDANIPRPSEADTVMWVGTVSPNNADLSKDMWVNST